VNEKTLHLIKRCDVFPFREGFLAFAVQIPSPKTTFHAHARRLRLPFGIRNVFQVESKGQRIIPLALFNLYLPTDI
jgi:hypothetical protein